MTTDTTIDRTTKVNLGILVTLLAATAGGSFYLSDINTSVQAMDRSIRDLKISLDRNTLQIVSDSRAQALLEAKVSTLERRIEQLESKRK